VFTEPEPFRLSTEFRAEKRAEFERWRVEHEQAADLERLHREQERLAAEEREVKRRRAEAVHRANPVRHFKPAPPRQVMALTSPHSPKFSDRLRSRAAMK
jgi:targeting protein for Xklp2